MIEISEIIFWVLIFYIIFSEDESSKTCGSVKNNKWRLKNNLRN